MNEKKPFRFDWARVKEDIEELEAQGLTVTQVTLFPNGTIALDYDDQPEVKP